MGQKFAAFDAQGNISAFYDSVDSPVPADVLNAIEITESRWVELMDAQSLGRRIVLDERHEPAVVDPLPPTRAEIASAKRAERDSALSATDWLIARHQDEKILGDGTTLTADQFAMLLRYRQSLREASSLPGWPNAALPSPPSFVSALEKEAM
ncbi:phage tail assembly chaperone [Burkholderia ambifaria]|jgi:hypothetical protein|uniref:phage tail assembly chaperone n=1 Tax=Burkholderia ambifaria TaxID=152480 RepID=UPI00158A510B|nr:phage tail assembly chaperone [Burkholderia ambifaria]